MRAKNRGSAIREILHDNFKYPLYSNTVIRYLTYIAAEFAARTMINVNIYKTHFHALTGTSADNVEKAGNVVAHLVGIKEFQHSSFERGMREWVREMTDDGFVVRKDTGAEIYYAYQTNDSGYAMHRVMMLVCYDEKQNFEPLATISAIHIINLWNMAASHFSTARN